MKKRFASVLLAAVLLCASASAIPLVKQYTPDFSGEFVYYRDNSFTSPSIIGIVYYNESTYGARYYCPADKAAQTVERDISIYFTIDAENNSIELTGENIFGSDGSQDDADIVNYLHDFFYEFAERRQKLDLQGPEAVTVTDDFAQFGGDVKITYNNLIPIFNMERLSTLDGDDVLYVETVGILTDSNDPAFSSYKGMMKLPKDKSRSFDKKAFAKAKQFSVGCQSVSLDDSWKQESDNMFLLGDNALLTLNEIARPELFKDSPDQFLEILMRKLSEGSSTSYTIWTKRKSCINGDSVKLDSIFWDPVEGNVTRDFKRLTKLSSGGYALLSLTVFDGVYSKKKSYFDKILGSLTIKE
ncbi:MAG: hypothetical protein K6G18_09840 [Treponema sp.]|nr:hypothetical protein [Treponema sp.]